LPTPEVLLPRPQIQYGVGWAGSIQTCADTVIASIPAMMLSGSFTWPFVPPKVA